MTQNHIHPYALTIDGAARFSGMARSRIYDLIAAGELKVFKIGKRTMILTAVLKAFIDRAAEQGQKRQ